MDRKTIPQKTDPTSYEKAGFYDGTTHWKRSVLLIWLSQCLLHLSFSFGIPFAPFLMQAMGVSGSSLSFWVALFDAGPALTTMLFSPFWGMMANLYGCKKMLLRCYFGGVVVLSGIALCNSPQWMIVFRLFQGVVCGSVPAALTLASSLVPPERTGFALGLVNSAVFSGLLLGSFFGGIAADLFGCKIAFLLSGAPCIISAVIMIFGVREHFTPPQEKKAIGNSWLEYWKKMTLNHWQKILAMPILCIVGIVMFGRVFDRAFLPLFVQQIHGSVNGAATWTGIIQALAGIAGILAGLTAGYLSDKFDPGKIALTMAGLSFLLFTSVAFAPGLLYLMILRPLSNFAVDCIEPSLQVWICRRFKRKLRNIIFAWAQSIRSIGWFTAALTAGLAVNVFGLRAIYVAGGMIFLLVMILTGVFYRRECRHVAPPDS